MHLKFITASRKSFGTCVTYILFKGKVVMAHVLFEYHIKVKKSGGAFKLSQQFSCTTIVACLDSDLKESKDKKKVVCEPRLQA